MNPPKSSHPSGNDHRSVVPAGEGPRDEQTGGSAAGEQPRYAVPPRPGLIVPLGRLLRRLVRPSLPRPEPVTGGGPRYPFAPYPRGWYALGFSEDVAPGRHRTVAAFGEDWVLWRGASGRVSVTHTTCPHLGADLGQGSVDGDELRCPMHAFCFDVEGACTRTGYGTRVPPKLRSRTLPVVERAGLIFCHYDPQGVDPEWALPELPEAVGSSNKALFRMGTHVQDIAENTADIGHFASTHGYHDVVALADAEVGPRSMRSRYALLRSAEVYGAPTALIRTELDITLHGLGLYAIRGRTTPGGVATFMVFAATPVSPEQLDFRARIWVNGADAPADMGRVFAWLPDRPRRWLMGKSVLLATLVDIQEDAELLNRKRYLARPALAHGDGDVGRFRRWARRFQPADAAAEASHP